MYIRPDEIQQFIKTIKSSKSYALLAILLIAGVLFFNYSEYFRFRRFITRSKQTLTYLYLIIVILNIIWLFTQPSVDSYATQPSVDSYATQMAKRTASYKATTQGNNNETRNFDHNLTRNYDINRSDLTLGHMTNSQLQGNDSTMEEKLRNVVNLVKTRKQVRNVSNLKKKIVAANQHWKCGICGQMLDETYEVDHIIPLYRGGSNEISNLMALDPICHKKKTFRQQYLGNTSCEIPKK